MPVRISSHRIKKTFSAPALATAAKGTSRPRSKRTDAGINVSRGTSDLRPTATVQDAPTAAKYDLTSAEVVSGEDLLALALLMATLSDWFVICHATVPNV